MATELSAARLPTFRAALEKDRGAERVTLEAAMAKAFATEAAQRIVDDAVQILGGRGVLASPPPDRPDRPGPAPRSTRAPGWGASPPRPPSSAEHTAELQS